MTSVSEIKEMLRPDAASVARELLPMGHEECGGREWRCPGSVSPTGEAISVHIGRGPKQGTVGFWNSYPAGGDLINLAEVVFGDRRQAFDWAKGWVGMGDAKLAATPLRKPVARRPEEAARLKQRVQTAANIWRECQPLAGPAREYLISRGLDPSFADAELRLHRGLEHPDGGTYPALVGRVTDVAGNGTGLWRIYVAFDGSGKAPVENPKLGLGPVRGGSVRLGGIAKAIGVAEGIETALAVRQMEKIPVWAALSTSGMQTLELPEEVESVTIFADHDVVKFRNGLTVESPGLKAAELLRERLARERGIFAWVAMPPPGFDWLDVLNLSQGFGA